MFFLTHTDIAPWTILKSDDKMRARINAMRHVLHVMDYKGRMLRSLTLPIPP